ncbi:hypothetical protein BpHYR1_024301 [Brachionus plicatilis]|uniref:Uncharacterized protein n=1 Tax=Brachionus plicatilis TaxID=10195 RepID=A0A3M7SD17_BRAPC|nr:hypothetical protein BpHYR1_024301 [Brachionus plicatilis]
MFGLKAYCQISRVLKLLNYKVIIFHFLKKHKNTKKNLFSVKKFYRNSTPCSLQNPERYSKLESNSSRKFESAIDLTCIQPKDTLTNL